MNKDCDTIVVLLMYNTRFLAALILNEKKKFYSLLLLVLRSQYLIRLLSVQLSGRVLCDGGHNHSSHSSCTVKISANNAFTSV
jgi:hypothetical protein